MNMTMQSSQKVLDHINANDDSGFKGARYTEAGGMPMIADAVPVTDTDIALFEGQMVVRAGVVYIATNVTDTTTTWNTITLTAI